MTSPDVKTELARPVPVPEAESAGFWEAAARHELAIARCSQCGVYSHPPDTVCAACGSIDPDFQFTVVSGGGRIRSWTVVRRALLPGFANEIPFLLVDVELDEQEGLRMTGRLLDGMDAPVSLDVRVQAAFEDIAPGVAVPAFRIATS